MAGSHSTIQFTTGTPGAGKTLTRGPRFLVEEFFRDDPDGTSLFIHNLPLNADKIGEECARRYGGDPQQYEERIVEIPPDEMTRWTSAKRMPAESGPWDYFAGKDVSGAHIAIDELHHYCGSECSTVTLRKWERWLAESRHMGCTLEGLTQDPEKVAKSWTFNTALERDITHSGSMRDPIFGIQYGDWYELWAKFGGQYKACTVVTERTKRNRKWVVSKQEFCQLDPLYFPLFNSYSAPKAGGGLAAIHKPAPWERLTWWQLVRWFLGRNAWPIFKRCAIALAFVWFCAGQFLGLGGIVGVARYAMTAMNDYGRQKAIGAIEKEADRIKGQSANGKTPTTSVAIGKENGRSGGTAKVKTLTREQALLVEYRERLTKAEAELVELHQRKDAESAIVMLRPDGVTFRGGITYAQGERIEDGPFAGDQVAAVDLRKRLVRFESGRLLRLGLPTAAAPGSPDNLAGVLPAGERNSGSSASAPAVGATPINVGGGHAVEFMAARSSRSDGPLLRGATAIRSSADNVGSAQPAGVAGFGNGLP